MTESWEWVLAIMAKNIASACLSCPTMLCTNTHYPCFCGWKAINQDRKKEWVSGENKAAGITRWPSVPAGNDSTLNLRKAVWGLTTCSCWLGINTICESKFYVSMWLGQSPQIHGQNYSGFFYEGVLEWDLHLNQWTLSKAVALHNAGGPQPISWKV